MLFILSKLIPRAMIRSRLMFKRLVDHVVLVARTKLVVFFKKSHDKCYPESVEMFQKSATDL